MSSTQNTEMVDTKLEVVVIPVADVDRAKRFYQGLGWRLDADFRIREDFWVVQLTPPGSPCSVIFGNGIMKAQPGSGYGYLVVTDLDAARAALIARGVKVSETFHFDKDWNNAPGPDPDRRSYNSRAEFSDPDGNTWLLQEIKTRLPGRVDVVRDVASLTELLRETEQHHGEYEPTAPKHHWSGWYAAYMIARQQGKSSDEAAKDAALQMKK
jgi:catechol 2,3-dioxygenase-like lactoylglutathione lyase family enzyme